MTFPSRWLVHRYQSVTSTMDAAAHLAAAGARDRTAVVTAEQTAGRGRAGRSWQAPAGTALFCTLLLRPPVPSPRLSTLPLLAGVAVAEAIEELPARSSPLSQRSPHPPSPLSHCDGRGGESASPVEQGEGERRSSPAAVGRVPSGRRLGLRAYLKWPNDVCILRDGELSKVAGILVTSRLAGAQVDYVLVGIGVNVSARRHELPPGATSLLAVGIETTVAALFTGVLAHFDDVYREYVAADGRPSLDPWRARAALLGEVVTVREGNRERRGTFVDVDEDGALLLRQADSSLHRIVAGDLVRGPRR